MFIVHIIVFLTVVTTFFKKTVVTIALYGYVSSKAGQNGSIYSSIFGIQIEDIFN